MFCAACRNRADNVQLVQWLSLKVKPPPSDEVLFNSLITALTQNNTAVASWLDAHFHIMERATSTSKGIESKAAGSILVRVCKTHLDERGDGVKWLLNHPSMAKVEESLVVQAVRHLVLKTRLSTLPLFIIEKLPISEPLRNELLTGVMFTTIQRDTLTQVQKVISMGELNKEAVAKCLTSTDKDQRIHVSSSKVVKWLITHFQLERDHITLNNNALLLNLLSHHHSSCAEWLINMFRITFEEVLSLNITAFSEADLATWQMMLRVFPQITAPTIKQKLMCLVCQSPVTAQYTMRMFPEITTADVVEFWSTQSPYSVPLFVRLWLGDAIP
ncbi:hypothetical protein Pelo_4940 [Pelomyxa schiedti]|nr:hypothetical protein Pelo_4940 [Pelomyxa schiedti]